ncbi:MAG: tripartite tricarboxylate transporter TctB family protein, partial [Alphaproteobacteria bacterium]
MSEKDPASDEPAAARQHGLIHPTDLAIMAIVLAICGALYYVTTGFEEVSDMLAQNIPPEFFPRLVLLVIAILALGLPFEHLLHRRRGSNLDSKRSRKLRPLVFLTAFALVLLGFAMPYLGTFLAMMVICLVPPWLWGERRWKLIVPFAVLFPLAVALVFNRVLK